MRSVVTRCLIEMTGDETEAVGLPSQKYSTGRNAGTPVHIIIIIDTTISSMVQQRMMLCDITDMQVALLMSDD